jgi:integrase
MPAGRAENHAGSIRQLPSGHYGLQVMLGGQRHHVTGATKAEVREKRDALKARHRQQQLAPTRQDRQPVADYLRQWHALRRGTIEPSTWTRYGVEIAKRLVPTIGTRPLRALTADDVRTALQRMLEGHAPFTRAYAPRTVQYAYETLSLALKQAAQDGVVARNVAASVKPPKRPKTQARAFTADEVARLLAAATGDWRTLWLLALYSGLRLGELLGLAWTALDEEAGTVTVRQVLADDDEGGLSLRAYPKSAAGFRTVPLPAFVVEELRTHRQRQDAERAAASRWESAGDGLVFVSRFGTFLLRSNVARIFKQDCQAAGIAGRVHPHLCRHTFASHLLATRTPLPEVSYLLGHSSRSITLDVYGHFVHDGTGGGAADALTHAYRGAGRRSATNSTEQPQTGG